MQQGWKDLLASPARASHILQLYENDEFLGRAVAYFAGEGLKNGEAVLLTGTAAHVRRIRRELALCDVDAAAALRTGQLALTDVHEVVAALVPDRHIDAAAFEVSAGAALEQAYGDPRFSGVRWWSEITDTLHQRGATAAGLAAECLGDAAAKRYRAAVFCSFMCDRYAPQAYEGILKEVCCVHSHVIAAEDYARDGAAVDRAIAEVLGEMDGSFVRSLASRQGFGCSLPTSQAVLFWLRDTLPHHFEDVLRRAREYQVEPPR